MSSQVSRLDRQVVLLETGSTQFIRNMAADQLGDLARQHPEDILSLLSRVYPFLLVKKWETRVTAARAMGGIVAHAPKWDPNAEDDSCESVEGSAETAKVKMEQEIQLKLEEVSQNDGQEFLQDERRLFSLAQWNLHELLKTGKVLLASSVNGFSESWNGDAKVRKQARRGGFDDDSNEFNDGNGNGGAVGGVKAEDGESGAVAVKKQQSPRPAMAPANSKKSARMLAMAKRKKKMQAKSSSSRPVDLSESNISKSLMNQQDGADSLSPTTLNNPKLDITENSEANKIMVESMMVPILEKHERVAGLVWQFQGVYELLIENLMSEVWEVRHGAALGLRELLKQHAVGVSRVKGRTRAENDSRNRKSLEDCATRLLTIFALDRFGDYVYDTVVAPVRESAAQTLAALLIHLDEELSVNIFYCLKQLVLQDPQTVALPNKIWEATHGGLLGVRYFVSIKTDFLLSRNLLSEVVKVVLYGLNQPDDDVQSVAAAILSPITNEFVKLDTPTVDLVLSTIWSSLTHLDDDLSSSVGSVMDLLAKLCKHAEVLDIFKSKALHYPSEWSFKTLVPKLYLFLRHSISSVRKAVLNLLNAFLSIEDDTTKSWLNGKAFRLIFQNIILEQNEEILNLSFQVYCSLLKNYKSKHTEKTLDHALSKHLQPILHLLNTPIGVNGKNYNMESQYILKPSQHYQINPDKKRSISEANYETDIPPPKTNERVNIDAPMIAGDITLLGVEVIKNTRVMGARAFGITLAMFQNTTLKSFFENVLLRCLDLSYATPRMLAAIILTEFCKTRLEEDSGDTAIPPFVAELFGPIIISQLSNPETLPVFREFVPSLKALRTQCQNLLNTFVDVGMLPQHKLPNVPVICQGETDAGPEAFSIELAEKVYKEYYDKMFRSMSNSYKLLAKKPLEDAKHRVLLAIEESKASRREHNCSILANYASATLRFSGLPNKLNPVIRALMDSIKEEKNEILQRLSGDSIKHLVNELVKNGKTNVSDKIVKNLCGFLCVDTTEVPEFAANATLKDTILTLVKENNFLTVQDYPHLRKLAEEASIKRKGALYTLGRLLELFGEEALLKVPQLNKSILEPLHRFDELKNESLSNEMGQEIVDSLGIVRALFPFMHFKLQNEEVISRFPLLLKFLRSEYSVFRYSVARTFADLAKTSTISVMTFIIREILPLLNNAGSTIDRQGATELVYHLSVSLGADILPYVIFLIVPLLGRMSDSDTSVRSLATTTFASIIKLVPLEEGIADPEGLPQDLMVGREREREFMQQMMDPSKAEPFKMPVAVKATLRKYQQDGLNWLAFLNKYHLHGILCDDMGLGKTLQTICIIASDQYLRNADYQKTSSLKSRPLPSLIICPPSLTGHWESEFEQYSPFLKVIVYAGGPSTRFPLRDKLSQADVIVTSYDVARNDLNVMTKLDYNYCVLDEGHIIKNSQSKLAKAVKQFSANHRLILTGTPIQNNVVELWSLFDFLMPGFLGTEKMFQERFAKPIGASRNSKALSKDQEKGALALEALHKQVLPFMLRRLKEDVLSDLPPKIIQDYYCELSDLQKQLYKDFSKKQKNAVEKDIENNADVEGKQHIFQALQYMRKLCNHPALVLSPDHPQLRQVEEYLKQTHLDLHDITNAPKLGALRNLLLECGIGEQDVDVKGGAAQLPTSENVISQHRALIFCQLKDMLDMVENDLLKKYMPSVTYMRLDGSVEPRDRQKVVRKFTDDPSIDCLLLTTKVGGLGLNLTGADTVIFVEHDWNPMNDLQAMDRAHRLGQKKVVNVYRIITRGTLEEKIMGLQKFKMNIASTVVNQQNNGLVNMDTHQLLDLFDADNVPSQDNEEKQTHANGSGLEEIANETGLSGKAKEALGELKELWDPSQYEEEYNLDNFIKTLR